VEVVSSLCQDSSPIDRIHSPKLESLIYFGIGEESFDNVLVEIQHGLRFNMTQPT
jgi:hypothetical protein